MERLVSDTEFDLIMKAKRPYAREHRKMSGTPWAWSMLLAVGALALIAKMLA